ncbi:hypothetical protein [Bradyrhizobium sp. 2TAF24]|uniref:hypothetical protein n=1 Tax=Bradyrhizobium sp. 2TAF24 TaxID=3233011 RepID=UPI003F8D9AC6
MLVGFPLLLIPLAIVNIIAFLMPGVSFTDPLITVTLMSKVAWKVTFGDILIALGMLLLMFEVIKAARPGGKYFTDHFLALLVLAGAVAEFLLLPQFATSVFFLLTVLALVDFLAGVSLRLRGDNRRRAVAAPTSPRRPHPLRRSSRRSPPRHPCRPLLCRRRRRASPNCRRRWPPSSPPVAPRARRPRRRRARRLALHRPICRVADLS